MDVIVIVPERDPSTPAGQLLRLVTSLGWVAGACCLRSPGGPLRATASPQIAIPSRWNVDPPFPNVSRYEEDVDILATLRARKDPDGWIALQNGRWAVEMDGRILQQARRACSAQVLAVHASADQQAYNERLRQTSDGTVLGFRRFYHAGARPAALPSDWPHLLLLNGAAVEACCEGGRVPASFAALLTRCRSRGLTVRSVAVAGEARDLTKEQGLLAFYEHLLGRRKAPPREDDRKNGAVISPGARVVGNVCIEAGVHVEEGAVVVGPVFLGAGSRVSKDAFLRTCIVGPQAVVPAGKVLRNRVFLHDGGLADPADGRVEASGVTWPVESGGGSWRTWPLLSYPRLGKRIFDVVASSAALALLVIVFPAIAVAIRLTSKGSVFYRHRRQGRHGKEFFCLKFRTMVQTAEKGQDELRALSEVDGPQFKIEDDPRVTQVGAFLRETNLDELPQFLNVLAGRMSIVGPRPSPDEENQTCPFWREARLSVRPGITGLWQVSRSRRGENDFQEWIYYDTEYVRHLTFWRDVVIMAKTAGIMLGKFLRLYEKREGTVANVRAKS